MRSLHGSKPWEKPGDCSREQIFAAAAGCDDHRSGPQLRAVPGMVMPITSAAASIAAAQQAVREQRQVGILMQREAGSRSSPIDMHRMGTLPTLRYAVGG
jgi:hypothetical protein